MAHLAFSLRKASASRSRTLPPGAAAEDSSPAGRTRASSASQVARSAWDRGGRTAQKGPEHKMGAQARGRNDHEQGQGTKKMQPTQGGEGKMTGGSRGLREKCGRRWFCRSEERRGWFRARVIGVIGVWWLTAPAATIEPRLERRPNTTAARAALLHEHIAGEEGGGPAATSTTGTASGNGQGEPAGARKRAKKRANVSHAGGLVSLTRQTAVSPSPFPSATPSSKRSPSSVSSLTTSGPAIRPIPNAIVTCETRDRRGGREARHEKGPSHTIPPDDCPLVGSE